MHMYGKTHNQQGFASIAVALTLIIILGLLTTGFAQLARHEQQTALDKQLAVQAFDAAESGINDAVRAIEAHQVPSNTNPDNCYTLPGGASPTISAANTVSYSCVLIDMQPPSLEYSGVDPDEGRSVSFSTSNTLSELTVSWGSSSGRNAFRSGFGFPPRGGWSFPAVLQFSITPLTALDRTSLINNTFNTYMYPMSGGANTVNYGSAQGQVIAGACDTATSAKYPCSVTITGLSADRYVVHLIDYYDSSNITISGEDASGAAVDFINGQAQVDVTGKAKDVLKRLRVRIPLNQPGRLPDYAVESQDFCKRQQTEPSTTTYVGLNRNPASASNDPSCILDN